MNHKLHFKTNVQLKSIIGKDLINDDNIAILELVKNSFDADAKSVYVKYLNQKENDDLGNRRFTDKTSRLIIQDNGVGMSIEDIKNKWLNIAYSEKKSIKNKHKRRMAGAKGVGRFSCDRLGEYLNLYTKQKHDKNYYKLKIEWEKFEIEGSDIEIQSIPLEYEILNEEQIKRIGIDNFENGVLLEIIKLRSKWVYPLYDKNGKIVRWDFDKLIELKKYLEKLINPNQAFEVNDFGIFLEAPDFEYENSIRERNEKFLGKVDNKIFDKLEFKSSSIETYTIDGGENIFTELKDKGETIYWLKEKNIYYPYIKNVRLNTYFLNSYAKAFFTKQTGIQSVNYGSIFLFINGFRIPPYGDVDNDWLGLDSRKAQGTKRYLGSRDLIGQIEILDDEDQFQIISSREGVVNNENFKKLTSSDKNDSFFYKSLRRLERYVVEGLNWDSSIYDSADREGNISLKEIESKIISGELTQDELEYREDEWTKKSRIYSIIHPLIYARPSEVLELYINEDIIIHKLDEERYVAEQEFVKLLEDFGDNKLDLSSVNDILEKRTDLNKELRKQVNDFLKFNINESTRHAILEIEKYVSIIEDQNDKIQSLSIQLAELSREKDLAEKNNLDYKIRIEQAEKNVKQAEKSVRIEKEKNLYLLATRRTLSADADGLIHTIKINSIDIRDGIDNIIEDLIHGSYDTSDLIKRLGFIKLCAERSLKMSEFATRSDLKQDIEKRDIDIVAYFKEYVHLYGNTFSDKLSFDLLKGDFVFYKKLSVLNVSIILDNILSNAVKWGADKISFEFELYKEKQLLIFVSDNGVGLSNTFHNDPDRIFELATREIPPSGLGGSGIGLYYTKELLNEMNGDIQFIGNNLHLTGATFKLIFNSL